MEDHNFYPQKPELTEDKTDRNTGRTVFSILIFILALLFIGTKDFNFIFFILIVLIFHELGHFSMMKLFHYSNVKMLFVPLMGAFVQGKKEEYQQKQSFIVVFAGPIPGIFFGIILMFLGVKMGYPWMLELSKLFLLLNMLNLFPLDPLDGGQILKLLVNKKHEFFQLVFSFVSSIVIIGLGWFFDSVVVIVFGFFMGFRVRSIQKNYQIHKELDEEEINFKTTYKSLSNKDFSRIKQIVLSYTPALRTYMDQVSSEKVDPLIAEQVNNVLVSPLNRNASFLFRLMIVIVWVLAFILPIFFANYLKLIHF